MENDQLEMTNGERKSKAKIIVPIIIVLIVAGIWVAKDMQKNTGGLISGGGDEEFVPQNKDFALNVTVDFDFEKLKTYNLPIMLDFGSPTCPPCREMAPALRKVHRNMHEKAIIKYIDVQEFKDLTADYPVRVVPTQFFFDSEGKPYMPKDPEKSQMILYTTNDTEEHVLTAHEGALTEDQMLKILEEMGIEE